MEGEPAQAPEEQKSRGRGRPYKSRGRGQGSGRGQSTPSTSMDAPQLTIHKVESTGLPSIPSETEVTSQDESSSESRRRPASPREEPFESAVSSTEEAHGSITESASMEPESDPGRHSDGRTDFDALKPEITFTEADVDRRQSFSSPRPPSESGSIGGGRVRRLSGFRGDTRRISIGLGGVPKRGYWGGLDDSDSDDSLLAHSRKPSLLLMGPTLMGYNKRQWMILIVFAMVDFLSAMLISIQPQLYPAAALVRNVSPTEYGILFGVFELTIFIMTPTFFKLLAKIEPKLMFNLGILTIGTSAILFSFLDDVEDKLIFLTISFILRIIEGIGDASCITAAYAIITVEFPEAVGRTLASLEAFLGLGFIVGPPLAGALFQASGFMVPFLVFGILVLVSGLMSVFVMPKPKADSALTGELEKSSGGITPGFITLLQIPTVALASFSILAASISLGFINCTLYAHLQQFMLSAVAIGGIFILNQGMYSLSAPIWNILVNRIDRPQYVSLLGTLLIFTAFLFIGPVTFIPVDTILEVTCAGLFVHGLGLGAIYVSGFILTLRDTTDYGFPDNEATYGLASGLYTSTFTFGSFIGLTGSGIIFDSVGFQQGSIILLGIHGILAVSLILFLIFGKNANYRSRHSSGMLDETEPLLNPDSASKVHPVTFQQPQWKNPLKFRTEPGGSGTGTSTGTPTATTGSPAYGTSTSYESLV